MVGVVSALVLVTAAPQPISAQAPAALATEPTPTVGALYVPSAFGLGPTLGLPHECTASVVHSATHDLVLTAAHCIAGTGLGYEFAPAYANGALPFGTWPVTRVYLNRSWTAHRDAQHDYAFLRVARQPWHGVTRAVEDVVGANTLGTAPAPGTSVTVVGYAAGSNDRPLTCTTRTYLQDGFPAFDCDGFVDGTSGSPWLDGTPGSATIRGVIGGLHGGGCTAATSYSSSFGGDIVRDLQRAESGRHGDLAPLVIGDDCS